MNIELDEVIVNEVSDELLELAAGGTLAGGRFTGTGICTCDKGAPGC
jgi:hypothetical protein